MNVWSTGHRGSQADGDNFQSVQEPPHKAQKATKMPTFLSLSTWPVFLQEFFHKSCIFPIEITAFFKKLIGFFLETDFFFLEVDALQAGLECSLSALRVSIGHTNISMVSLLVHTWLGQ